VSFAELRGDVVILACAVSAGIHGALAPAHFDEGFGAGVGFVAATVVLALLVVALTRRPTSERLLACAVVALLGLILSYLLAVTTGLPVIHPKAEPIDGLALATKAIEAVGLLAASSLLRRPRVGLSLLQPKGNLT
jgi:CHASE2 domain-containing sensor protein